MARGTSRSKRRGWLLMKGAEALLAEHDHHRDVVRVRLLAQDEGIPYEVEELRCAACDELLEEGKRRLVA